MAAKIIDGQGPAEEIKQDLAHEVEQLIAAGTAPHLVAVQVGENPASKIYTNMQAKACESVGIEYELRTLPAEATEADLLDLLARANSDQAVTGIILQMPLPSHFDAREMQMALAVEKDVEGMHPENLGKLFYGGGAVGPCTAMSAVELLQRTVGGKAKLAGLEVVIVGHSEVFGKPAAVMLLDSFDFSPTVTICHVATKDLAFHTSRADVVIVATGVRQIRWQGYKALKKANPFATLPDLSPLVSADMLKEGAIVIDVAINRIPKGFDDEGQPLRNEAGKLAMQTVGDVDFDGAMQKVAAITPVPGGVGQVTTAMLLKNTVACTKALAK
ncbi:MAG: bifunctional 5,10-methylenetetrahydrofolate dehydrogenase/5,10-methenyltetrahydrofolate cyclohydrolase [Planctomycetota bacterium]|nr:MAG: bifunctional 5,10-methylenetetrahydrofolate dehydrogenase/5,10-methenyltetrahydrofolate cyclohydrolase [Planctomycetota bacterium]